MFPSTTRRKKKVKLIYLRVMSNKNPPQNDDSVAVRKREKDRKLEITRCSQQALFVTVFSHSFYVSHEILHGFHSAWCTCFCVLRHWLFDCFYFSFTNLSVFGTTSTTISIPFYFLDRKLKTTAKYVKQNKEYDRKSERYLPRKKNCNQYIKVGPHLYFMEHKAKSFHRKQSNVSYLYWSSGKTNYNIQAVIYFGRKFKNIAINFITLCVLCALLFSLFLFLYYKYFSFVFCTLYLFRWSVGFSYILPELDSFVSQFFLFVFFLIFVLSLFCVFFTINKVYNSVLELSRTSFRFRFPSKLRLKALLHSYTPTKKP